MKITAALFERKLFVLFILVLVVNLVLQIGKPIVELWGINKTVGWANDLTVPNIMITCVISLLFTLTYFTFYIFKKKTNRILSLVHLVAFSFIISAYKFLDEGIIFFLNCISITLFLANAIWTLVPKNNHDKTGL